MKLKEKSEKVYLKFPTAEQNTLPRISLGSARFNCPSLHFLFVRSLPRSGRRCHRRVFRLVCKSLILAAIQYSEWNFQKFHASPSMNRPWFGARLNQNQFHSIQFGFEILTKKIIWPLIVKWSLIFTSCFKIPFVIIENYRTCSCFGRWTRHRSSNFSPITVRFTSSASSDILNIKWLTSSAPTRQNVTKFRSNFS